MTCLDENAAVELVLGDADADAAASQRAHVAECEVCRRLVGGVARVLLSASHTDDEGWADADEPIPPNTRIGSYTVLGVIGRGGMGVVHAARDDRLRRNVALKLLRADAYDVAAVARLRREAQLLAQLSHPNVVTVHDVGVGERGPFLAMELVEGMDLRRWLGASPRGLGEILRVFREAAQGLAAAHVAGLVHRDFKPANVLVGSDGRVVVADFGLATPNLEGRSGGEASVPASVVETSATRAFVGTPAYMAPEQLRGDPADARSDQFSFCVALFEAVHGVRPFAGSTAPALLESMHAGAVRAGRRRVRRRLAAAMQHGLACDPSARFASMAPLVAALEHRPFRPRGLALVAAAAVIVAAAWPRSDAEPRCEQRSAWTPERRDALAHALADGAGPATASVLGRIDAYAQAWTNAYAGACAVDETHLDRSMACLRARESELVGIADALRDADDRGRSELHRALARLAPPHDCTDPEYLALRFSADPSLQAELSDLTTRAERARATRSPELYGSIHAALADLHERSELAGQPGLAAETLRIMSVAEIYREDYALAERQLEEAFFLAQLAGDRRLAFDIAMEASLLIGSILAELDRAREWNGRARVLLQEIDGASRRIEFALREVDVLLHEDRGEEALDALAAVEPLFGDDTSAENWASFLDKRARAKMATHDIRGAADDWTLGLRTLEDERGPEHPDVLGPLNGLAIVHIMLNDEATAATYLERALAIEDETLGSTRAYLLGNLAMLHEGMGELDRAAQELLEADRIFEQYLGLDHPMSVKNAVNLARVFEALERWPQAERYATRAIAQLDAGPERTELEAMLAGAP